MIRRYKRPDKKNALSLIESAKKDIEFTLSLKPTNQSSSTIVRNIYESFRMLGDALLISKGIESTDHIEPIKELARLNIDTKKPLASLQNIRMLRHNLNYYGYSPNNLEVEEIIEYAKEVFPTLFKEIKKILND